MLVPFPRRETFDQLTGTEVVTEGRHVPQQDLTHGAPACLCQLEPGQPARLGRILRRENLPGFDQRYRWMWRGHGFGTPRENASTMPWR